VSKRDDLLKGLGNVRESMGQGVVHGAPAAGPRATPAHLVGVHRSKDASQIAVERIERDPEQPREEFDEESLARLAESLKTRGQLQPIRVRWNPASERYTVLCGERRWRAAKMAGLETLACIVVEGELLPHDRLAIQLVENALRDDLSAMEQSRAFRSLMDSQGWSVRQLASELSIHHSQVVRAVSLLDLPEAVQARVEEGTLSPSTAYEISKAPDDAAQVELAERAVTEGLTRAETVKAVKRSAGKSKMTSKRKTTERTFRALGSKVLITNPRGLDDTLVRNILVELLRQVEDREAAA